MEETDSWEPLFSSVDTTAKVKSGKHLGLVMIPPRSDLVPPSSFSGPITEVCASINGGGGPVFGVSHWRIPLLSSTRVPCCWRTWLATRSFVVGFYLKADGTTRPQRVTLPREILTVLIKNPLKCGKT